LLKNRAGKSCLIKGYEMIAKKTSIPTTTVILVVWTLAVAFAQAGNVPPRGTVQRAIASVERMPRVPEPLAVRYWRAVSISYYERILDPNAVGDGFPVVEVKADKAGFRMKSYVGSKISGEGISCLSAVVGARLAGLDPRNLYGIDYVSRCKAWYDPVHGFYRHTVGERSPVVHSGIYGYWNAVVGTMLAAQYPEDAQFKNQAITAARAFHVIARGLGCPDRSDYDVLGWDFENKKPGGRNEPMNRLGHAPSVAWMLLVGATMTGDQDMVACARATLRWYAENPGRYEITHVMGPLAAARLNARGGPQVDIDRILSAWFGDGDPKRHTWRITRGMRFGGITCDGLDGARWGDDGFYAFTMGSLQGPAWLVPVVRYDQRYARAIARYALNAANSVRLLQGEGLDSNHQDHAEWKAKWDPRNHLFYEGLKSWDPGPDRSLRPYATGDPVLLGWNPGLSPVDPNEYFVQRSEWFGNSTYNLSLYMGNHVGFLGGIVELTDVPGILRWDCLATDWLHPPAYPTHLYYNPFQKPRTITLHLAGPADLYDLVAGAFVARNAKSGNRLTLAPDQVSVLVQVPPGSKIIRQANQLQADGVVIDYRKLRAGKGEN
jgi:hypothetical protein